MSFESRPVMERFWEKVMMVPESGCWVWTARCDKAGYGRFWVNRERKHMEAYRFAYEYFIGPVPHGLEVDHTCRVRCCVNPAHLEAVTGRVNVLRGVSLAAQYAKRETCKRGHKLVEGNIYRYGNARACRTCARLAHFRRYAENRPWKKEYRPRRDTKIFLEKRGVLA